MHPIPLASVLEEVRSKHNLPGLAGAIFTCDGILERAAVGMRKAGTSAAVTNDDLWHLGSNTKAMTAMLAGTFVAEGKLAWNTKVLPFFPEFAEDAAASLHEITVDQLLSHQAGLVRDLKWQELAQDGSVISQRLAAVHLALKSPAHTPGTYQYANTSYVVMAAILEKISGQSWEEMMEERIFRPLEMKSAGFGGVGTRGQIDQPWPHKKCGTPASCNGPMMDNPAVIGPSGRVHCSVADWSKFLADQLRGRKGALLAKEIYEKLQTPAPNSEYGYGWMSVPRAWAGGNALTHSGTNAMNFSVCWLAPEKQFGVLACSNQGGEQMRKPCDDAVAALIRRYLAA